MSFDNLCRLEAQPSLTRLSRYSNSHAPGSDITSLSSQISSLDSTVSRLSSLLDQVGGKRDSEKLREDVKGLLVQTREDFKIIGESVREAQRWKEVSGSQQYSIQKLSVTFSSTLRRFQSLQRISAEKTSQRLLGTLPRPKPRNRGQVEWQVQPQLLQKALADQSEVELQESMVLQREEEIQSLQKGIEDINEIYKSLADIVSLQGGDLNDITVHVVASTQVVKMADTELRHAFKWQRKVRKRACSLLLLSTILFGIVLLVILAG